MRDTPPPRHSSSDPGFKTTLLHTSEAIPVVSAFGEIDLASADGLRNVISEAFSRLEDEDNPNGCMILDLHGVEFMDSMGLAVLLEARRKLLETAARARGDGIGRNGNEKDGSVVRPVVVLDLGGLSFMDSMGLGALIESRKMFGEFGRLYGS